MYPRSSVIILSQCVLSLCLLSGTNSALQWWLDQECAQVGVESEDTRGTHRSHTQINKAAQPNDMTRDLYGSIALQTTNTQLLTIWCIVSAVAQCASQPQPHFSIRKGTAVELLRVRLIKVAHGILQSCDPRTDRFQQSWTVGDLFRQCIWKLPGAVDGKTSTAFECPLNVMVLSA